MSRAEPALMTRSVKGRSRRILAVALAATGITLSSCRKEARPVDLVTFPLYGRVLALDTTALRVTIRHDSIPHYMPGMIMPFRVKDPSLLRGITPGDSVGATLAISRTESWLESVQVLHKGDHFAALTPGEVEFKRLYQDGEIVPDIQLVNEDDRVLRLSDFRGKVLALTFVYTRCPLPDYCVRMSEQFAQAEKALKVDGSLTGRWHLLSISFDPAFDRPTVLKQYGRNYGADFSDWDFATDPDTTGKVIGPFADGFGLDYAHTEGLITHNLRTAVIDPKGRLVKVFHGNDWKPEQLISAMRASL